MKKVIIQIFFLIIALSTYSQSGKVFLGYCDGQIGSSSSGSVVGLSGSNAVIAEAICIPADMLAEYRGMKMTGVHCGMPETTEYPLELTAWARTSRLGSNIASGSTATVNAGWLDVSFAEPYVITGEEKELWIGFEFIQVKKISVISFAGKTNTNACWVGKNGVFTDYSSKEYGSLSVEAIIESDKIVTRDLSITSLRPQKSLVHLDEDVTLNVTISNNASTSAENPNVAVTFNGNVVAETAYSGTLAQRETAKIPVTIPASVFSADDRNVSLTATVAWTDGGNDQKPDDNSLSTMVTRSETFYTRRMVVEEGTGAWCGYCVKGIVGMKHMREKYPDRFIGIAVHNDDEYVVTDYDYWLSGYLNGSYPGCVVNRHGSAISPDTLTLERQMQQFDADTDCDIQLTADIQDTNVTIHATTTFLTQQTNTAYRMAFVLCQDSMPIVQKNYYAGGSKGQMGGFENLPANASINVDDVARAVYPDVKGMADIMPSEITPQQKYEYQSAFALPETVLPLADNGKNMWLAALLLDGETGEIKQAAKCALTTDITGIREIVAEDNQNCSSAVKPNDVMYNLSGQRITLTRSASIYIRGGKKFLMH